MYTHACTHSGHLTMYNSLSCTHCGRGRTVTKCQSRELDLKTQIHYDYEELVTSTGDMANTLEPNVFRFLLELHKGVNSELFATFMRQPSTKPCSKELDLQRPIEEIAATCACAYHWYMLNQLRRIMLHSANNARKESLQSLMYNIEETTYSYLDKSGRIFQLPQEIIFVIDHHYRQFPIKNLYLIEECVRNFLREKRGLEAAPNLFYWIAEHTPERFTGTHNPITDKYYDKYSTALVTGQEKSGNNIDSDNDSIPMDGDVLRGTQTTLLSAI